jgi:hypothetical protein
MDTAFAIYSNLESFNYHISHFLFNVQYLYVLNNKKGNAIPVTGHGGP